MEEVIRRERRCGGRDPDPRLRSDRATFHDLREDAGMPMQPNEIFELIVKADEKLKYATADKTGTRRQQAKDLYTEALEAAREIGNEALVRQAELRLSDLA
jgi:hypothetical protein